jgi:hypothetical protein
MKKLITLILAIAIGSILQAQINAKHIFGNITPSDLKVNTNKATLLGITSTQVFLKMSISETAWEVPIKKGGEGQYFSATGIGLSAVFDGLKDGQVVERFNLHLLFFTPNSNPVSNLSTALAIGVPIPKLNLPNLTAGVRYDWKARIAYLQTTITIEL